MNANLKLKVTLPVNYQLVEFNIFTKDINGIYNVPLTYSIVESSMSLNLVKILR